uniref:Uncharacterized protein n=1 Tax=viral metagenome TaxID=1070528 RepID=A0A6C0BEG7_9ZZZZ
MNFTCPNFNTDTLYFNEFNTCLELDKDKSNNLEEFNTEEYLYPFDDFLNFEDKLKDEVFTLLYKEYNNLFILPNIVMDLIFIILFYMLCHNYFIK